MVLVQLCTLAWALLSHALYREALKETKRRGRMLEKCKTNIAKLENDLGWADWRNNDVIQRANERLSDAEHRATKAERGTMKLIPWLNNAKPKVDDYDRMKEDRERLVQAYVQNRDELIESDAALDRSLQHAGRLKRDRLR